jgi:hypothetical protein
VPEGFVFLGPEPWEHQLATFIANIANDGFNDWLDLGTGKTKVAIDTCRYWKMKKGGPYRVLVVCLNSAVGNWRDEIEMHSDMRATMLTGKIEDRWEMLEGEGFFIVNYEGLRLMMTKKEKKRNHTGKIVGKLVGDGKRFNQMKQFKFDCIIADESHRSIYNVYKNIFEYFDSIQLGLTATPKDVIDHNTFSLFNCEDGLPTFAYSYEEALENIPKYRKSASNFFGRNGDSERYFEDYLPVNFEAPKSEVKPSREITADTVEDLYANP